MKALPLIIVLIILASCNDDQLSYLSIRNETTHTIYAVSYSSSYSNGDWIQPGLTDEFHSLNIEHINGFEYFSFYYDSVVVYLKDYEDHPVKFYKDGTTINYNATLNPFINSEVWHTRYLVRRLPGSNQERLEEKQINEDYFRIEPEWIKSLGDAESVN